MNIFPLEETELCDQAVKHGLAPATYFTCWNECAQWHMDALEHFKIGKNYKVLDIGCGAMRFGLSAVNYLNNGNYCGIDPHDKYLNFGAYLIKNYLSNKEFTYIHDEDFNFQLSNMTFDFAIAQSVITHISNDRIENCLSKMKVVMKKGSKFLFSFCNGSEKTLGFLYDGHKVMTKSSNLSNDFFYDLGKKLGIEYSPINDFEHLSGQSLGLYIF